MGMAEPKAKKAKVDSEPKAVLYVSVLLMPISTGLHKPSRADFATGCCESQTHSVYRAVHWRYLARVQARHRKSGTTREDAITATRIQAQVILQRINMLKPVCRAASRSCEHTPDAYHIKHRDERAPSVVKRDLYYATTTYCRSLQY